MTAGETYQSCLKEIEDLPACKKYAKDIKVSMYMYDRPSWTGHVYETEAFFPTWINKETAPHVQALVDAHHALWGTERIGADEKAMSTRTGRPLTDKWTFSTNGVSIPVSYTHLFPSTWTSRTSSLDWCSARIAASRWCCTEPAQ